jgi:hypothetical protein
MNVLTYYYNYTSKNHLGRYKVFAISKFIANEFSKRKESGSYALTKL